MKQIDRESNRSVGSRPATMITGRDKFDEDALLAAVFWNISQRQEHQVQEERTVETLKRLLSDSD